MSAASTSSTTSSGMPRPVWLVLLVVPHFSTAQPKIKPEESLDLNYVVGAFSRFTLLGDARADGEYDHCSLQPRSNLQWQICSALAPYSTDFHVIILNMDPARCLPGPTSVPRDEVIGSVLPLISSIVEFASTELNAKFLNFGWNWSPRSWGVLEESNGFQSVRTKWHPMFWTWDTDWRMASAAASSNQPFSNSGGIGFSTASIAELSELQRVYFITRHEVLVRDICKNLNRAMPPQSQSFIHPWEVCHECSLPCLHTTVICTDSSHWSTITSSQFWVSVIEPVSQSIVSILCAITESATQMNCSAIDSVVDTATRGPLSVEQKEYLRSAPQLNPNARKELVKRGFDPEIMTTLEPLIRNRCDPDVSGKTPTDVWRKAFGYSFVIQLDNETHTVEMRLLIGVSCGPGGQVECLGPGVYLTRDPSRAFDGPMLTQFNSRINQLAHFVARRIPGVCVNPLLP
ncbi:hypothetical protein Pelo_12832 [Pelomyxa schiedti]|nr:hypothetical protein Pelo_12832 [Pelomyxa schiedti]